MKTNRGIALRVGVLVLCGVAGLSAAAFAFGGTRTAAAKVTKVTVTATEFKFKLSRSSVPIGTVAFTVVNKGKIGHDFKIAGKKTKLLNPGKSQTLTVTFKKKGQYAYLCTVPGHAANGMKGKLAVATKAVTTTSTTTQTTTFPGPGGTVAVSEFEWGFSLTPSTVPSGNVTFVMTNNGTQTHNFDIQGAKAGPFLDPGKSASMTVNLQAGRSYTYVCDVPFHAEMGMEGTFTPAG